MRDNFLGAYIEFTLTQGTSLPPGRLQITQSDLCGRYQLMLTLNSDTAKENLIGIYRTRE